VQLALDLIIIILEKVPILLYKNCSQFVVDISDSNILSFFGSVSFDHGSILGQRAQGQHSPSVTTTQIVKQGLVKLEICPYPPQGPKMLCNLLHLYEMRPAMKMHMYYSSFSLQ